MTVSLWLIPLIPLAGFAVNGLLGTRLGKSFVSAVGVGSVALTTARGVRAAHPVRPGRRTA